MSVITSYCRYVAVMSIFVLFASAGCVWGQNNQSYTRFVNPFLGTDFLAILIHGHPVHSPPPSMNVK